MEVRPGANPNDVKNYDTDRLRHDFLIQDVFVPGEIKTIYSQIDRIIVGSATPADKALKRAMSSEQHTFLREERWVSSTSVARVQ